MSSDTAFRMRCPKCSSTNVDLEEDQRAYLGGGRHQVQLHCYMCGHIIYGEKRIQAECDAQYSAWKENRSEPVVEAPPAPAPAAAPAAADEAAESDASESAASAAPSSAPESGRAKERPARAAAARASSAKKADASLLAPEPDGNGRATGQIDDETGLEIIVPLIEPPLDKKGRPLKPCSWPPCAKYARANSKYCSRNCSNKNARARYARRNHKESEAE